MKALNIIRKIIKLPFSILIMPFFIIMLFMFTDLEDTYDKKYAKETIKDLIW